MSSVVSILRLECLINFCASCMKNASQWLLVDSIGARGLQWERKLASSIWTCTISRKRYSTSGARAFAASSLMAPTSRL